MENNKLKIYEIEGVEALRNWFASCKNVLDGQTFEDYQKTRNWVCLQELIQKANNYVFSENYEVSVYFLVRENEYSEYSGRLEYFYSYIDHYSVELKDKKRGLNYAINDITIPHRKSEKMYLTRYNKEGIDCYFKSSLTEPKKYTKPSLKMLEAWGDYYVKLLAEMDEYREKERRSHAEFLKKIEGLPVKWTAGKRCGEIDGGNFVYKFELYDDGTVSQRIEKTYRFSNDLQMFLQLCPGVLDK